MSGFVSLVTEHVRVAEKSVLDCGESMDEAAAMVLEVLKSGHKILLCGNGGSAADSQHMAAEIVGRFETERAALPALALTTDSSMLTAIGNDFGFERIFARQLEGLARPGDLLWVYSTSGKSPNILAALKSANALGCRSLLFTGKGPNPAMDLAQIAIEIPSSSTARIQEMHLLLGHVICSAIDQNWAG